MADTVAFSYRAQTEAGRPLSGTFDAPDLQAARVQLQNLGLRVLEMAALPAPARPKPLTGDDFLAFNQQLAHLTAAGLPVEQGLRLIAEDMASGRLARTVEQVAGELEAGTALDQAFAHHAKQFPPLYGRLVAAGVKTNSLPAMLFNLGRHLELMMRVRASVWRACAYPLMVLGGLLIVMLFVFCAIVPQFAYIFADFQVQLPASTRFLFWVAPAVPYVIGVVVVIAALAPLTWQILRRKGADRRFADFVLLSVPVIGPILRRSLVARWCDGLRLGVEAGLDLPQAMSLAAEAIASPKVEAETALMIGELQAGRGLGGHPGGEVLPAAVWTAIQFGTEQHDLPATLAGMTQLYQQQAEQRSAMLPTILTPVLLAVTAGFLGFVIFSLFMPLVALIRSVEYY